MAAMVAAANMVEVAALVGDTARATILAALMGGQRAGISRPHLSADRKRTPHQTRRGAADRHRQAGALSLLPHRVAFGRKNA